MTKANVAMVVFAVGWSLPLALVAQQDAKNIIDTVVAHESEAANHRGHYLYMSEERSERTGGHLWSERVAETTQGKLHYLLAEDGQPLTGDRLAAEKAKLAGEASDPEAFKQKESARVDDEQHAKQMLTLLPKAFLFAPPKQDGDALRIDFRPNPDYSPSGLEERVLHSMSGSVLVDQKALRLRGIEGQIPQDVSLGFGLLATIHAGSNFRTTREHLQGADWKTQTLHTDIKGRALFLKTIARQQESKHSNFQKIADDLSVPAAVGLLEQETPGRAQQSLSRSRVSPSID